MVKLAEGRPTQHPDADHCDKGPILDQLAIAIERVEAGQLKMVDAVVEMARTQERIISLADKTTDNHEDIQNLFTLVRNTEAALKDHIIKAHTLPPTPHDPTLKTAAGNWTKLKASLVTAAALGLCKILYDFIVIVMDKIASGSTP